MCIIRLTLPVVSPICSLSISFQYFFLYSYLFLALFLPSSLSSRPNLPQPRQPYGNHTPFVSQLVLSPISFSPLYFFLLLQGSLRPRPSPTSSLYLPDPFDSTHVSSTALSGASPFPFCLCFFCCGSRSFFFDRLLLWLLLVSTRRQLHTTLSVAPSQTNPPPRTTWTHHWTILGLTSLNDLLNYSSLHSLQRCVSLVIWLLHCCCHSLSDSGFQRIKHKTEGATAFLLHSFLFLSSLQSLFLLWLLFTIYRPFFPSLFPLSSSLPLLFLLSFLLHRRYFLFLFPLFLHRPFLSSTQLLT